jgi:hypothetical protein
MQKVIFFAPYFPPSALPPSQRVRLLMPYFAKYKLQPVVFTVSHKNRTDVEDSWLQSITENYDFEKKEIPCFNNNLSRKIGIGDIGIRIMPFYFFYFIYYSLFHKPAFVLYIVPPWNILIIAPMLKFLTGVKYGIDYIDPWIVDDKKRINKNIKSKISHLVAKLFEKKAVKNASVIYTVSEGMNNDLYKRYDFLNDTIVKAVPYGAEKSDYDFFKNKVKLNRSSVKIIRYIGAVWADAYPVIDILCKVFKTVSLSHSIQVQFIGTSYASKELAKKQLDDIINKNKLDKVLTEEPLRVSYKQSIELTMQSDILLLFGGMQSFYAASKLMGLIYSEKPFLAFLHKDSHPALLLKELNYPYLVCYSNETGELPQDKEAELLSVFTNLLNNYNNFNPLDSELKIIKSFSAESMADKIIQPISKIVYEK